LTEIAHQPELGMVGAFWVVGENGASAIIAVAYPCRRLTFTVIC